MRKIQLTYWWDGHEPGDVVEVDESTSRELLGVIARPVEAGPESDDEESEPEPGR